MNYEIINVENSRKIKFVGQPLGELAEKTYIVEVAGFTDNEIENVFRMLKAFTCNFGDHIIFEKFQKSFIISNETRMIERLKSIEQLNAFMSGAIKANNKMFKVWED